MVEQVRRLRRDLHSRSGRPRSTVRPYYGGPPASGRLYAGRERGRKPPAGESLSGPGKYGSEDKNRRRGAPPGVCVFGIPRKDAG
jgi:hypothetical protein